MSKLLSIYLFLLLVSCVNQVTPIASHSSDYYLMIPGDLVVTNFSGDSALLLDSDGNYKSMLYHVENNKEQVVGAAWNPITNMVILTVNGLPDRIMAVDPRDGAVTEIVRDAQYSGNTYGVTVDSSGNYLAIESNSVEKFTSLGVRVNDGTYPAANILSGGAQIDILPGDGFVLCGTTTDRVRIFDADAVQLYETASGIGATTNAYGCAVTPSGNIIASWDGTSDSIAIYDSTLSTELDIYSDTAIISAPRGVAIKANGNFLIADATYHYLVELDPNLDYVRNLGGGILNSPYQVIEIPTY